MSAEACPDCGTEIGPRLLMCPSCHRLVHGDELKGISLDAQAATARGALADALALWRRALTLLPPESRQAQVISSKISELTREVDASAMPKPPPAKSGAVAGVLGATGLFVWKFKFLLVAILSKGKLLLLGLTKASTLFSMLLAFGAYWSLWGWRFAAGLLAMMYVHEMGHVAALRRYGIAATAPMFVPGLGAFVRLKGRLNDVREDAQVGLAGPVWGSAAALAAVALWGVTQWPSLAAMGRVGAWLNLFNLLPVWQLDGGRAFNALTTRDRIISAAALFGLWAWTAESLLLIIALAAAARSFGAQVPAAGDRRSLITYVGLAALLAALMRVPVA